MNTSDKSRTVAFLLAFFLGTFGFHRFYVGKGGTGVVMLLLTLSWFGLVISAIWALVDALSVALGSFTDKQGALVKNW